MIDINEATRIAWNEAGNMTQAVLGFREAVPVCIQYNAVDDMPLSAMENEQADRVYDLLWRNLRR